MTACVRVFARLWRQCRFQWDASAALGMTVVRVPTIFSVCSRVFGMGTEMSASVQERLRANICASARLGVRKPIEYKCIHFIQARRKNVEKVTNLKCLHI